MGKFERKRIVPLSYKTQIAWSIHFFKPACSGSGSWGCWSQTQLLSGGGGYIRGGSINGSILCIVYLFFFVPYYLFINPNCKKPQPAECFYFSPFPVIYDVNPAKQIPIWIWIWPPSQDNFVCFFADFTLFLGAWCFLEQIFSLFLVLVYFLSLSYFCFRSICRMNTHSCLLA